MHVAMLLKQPPADIRAATASAGTGRAPSTSYLELTVVAVGVVQRTATSAELNAVIAQGMFPKELSIAGISTQVLSPQPCSAGLSRQCTGVPKR
jgi:hypothetical protein